MRVWTNDGVGRQLREAAALCKSAPALSCGALQSHAVTPEEANAASRTPLAAPRCVAEHKQSRAWADPLQQRL